MSVKNPVLLTKNDLAKIVRWFDQRATRKSCPCCDESAVVIWPYLVCIPLLSQAKSYGQRFAVVSECRTCGHLQSFSAESIGLVTRMAPTGFSANRKIH